MDPITWLNNNLGFVTLFVGAFAIFLYLKQKSDFKKDSALLIIQEIRFAEAQIRNYRSSGSYPLSSTILPTNSWHKNVHMFVKDLSESEIDLISTFYSQANYIDILINKISEVATSQVDPAGPKFEIPQVRSKEESEQESSESGESPKVFGKLRASNILDEVSTKIEFIFNSPAVDKLTKISKKRWYFLRLF